jgi:hypothetical protein
LGHAAQAADLEPGVGVALEEDLDGVRVLPGLGGDDGEEAVEVEVFEAAAVEVGGHAGPGSGGVGGRGQVHEFAVGNPGVDGVQGGAGLAGFVLAVFPVFFVAEGQDDVPDKAHVGDCPFTLSIAWEEAEAGGRGRGAQAMLENCRLVRILRYAE